MTKKSIEVKLSKEVYRELQKKQMYLGQPINEVIYNLMHRKKRMSMIEKL